MKQKGFAIDTLFFAIIILFLAWVLFHNFKVEEELETLTANPPAVTMEQKKSVDAYSAMPTPTTLLRGEFTQNSIINGTPVLIRYYFSADNHVFKEVTIDNDNKHKTSGSAKYKFSGSVMHFSDMKGDLYLFSEIGEPLKVISDSAIELPGIGVLTRKDKSQ